MFLVESLNKFIKNGGSRSVNAKKNIAISFLVRTLSVGINFLIVPLTIDYINPVQYGVWLTLTSIISWFTFFDFGMGNGLRNTLTTAIAFKEYEKAKTYISTTYILFALIAVAVFAIFSIVNPYINWNGALNIPSSVDANIQYVLLVVLGCFCIQFVIQLLNTILTSLQEPARAELITLLGQIGLIFTLLVLKSTVKGSLDVLVIALNVVPLAILFIASFFLYSGRLKFIAPSFKYIDFSCVKKVLNVGGAFFLIQLGALILFQTDNIIITKVIGPEAVTRFNVTYKLYSIVIMGFSIIVNPYWSAFTDAYAKNDYEWIRGSVKRLREVWIFTSFVVVPIFIVSAKFVFKLWLSDTLEINFGLSVLMAIYVICYTCLVLNCYFLNGIGKLRLQLILYLFISISNIPLGVMFGKMWGIEGVIFANIVAFVFMNTLLWIQTNKILQQKAYGIWNK